MSYVNQKHSKFFYSSRLGFTLCQQNGQRTYGGPPPNWGARPPPSRDCEVFIGRLPRICFEDELIPLFLTAGELYEFRLMLDFSGTNRGYGYAHYATLEGAKKAIETLNKYEIRPGHPIGVLKSKNNCRLLFGNISAFLNDEAFSGFIHSTTEQVLNVVMFKNFKELEETKFRISPEVEKAFLGRMPKNNGGNNFAIVEYENHKAAAVARRVLIPKYGHILAIDWAVPPREKKRYTSKNDSQVPPVERPIIANPPAEGSILSLASHSNTRARVVPTLAVDSPRLENLGKNETLKIIVKFFKYQLSICLYKAVGQQAIPMVICEEMENKIIDRITSLESCSQAVQLISNYLSRPNEIIQPIFNSDLQKLLHEVKEYSDTLIFHFKKRIKNGEPRNPGDVDYFIDVLPMRLNLLFRIILRSDIEFQIKLSSGISAALEWVKNALQKGDQQLTQFVEEIAPVAHNDGEALDRDSAIAKTKFLNNITLQQTESIRNASEQELSIAANKRNSALATAVNNLEKALLNLNHQNLEGTSSHYIPMPFSQIDFSSEEARDINVFEPVPELLVMPSIMNKIPFMPDFFNNVPIFFKHIVRICVNFITWQLNIPPQITKEIETKIIERISNLENCSDGIQLILKYFSAWLSKNPDPRITNVEEAQRILREVKDYSDFIMSFVWRRSMSMYIPNEAEEEFIRNTLPLRLNILYHMMLIFSSESTTNYLIGITNSLTWLDELIQKGDKMAKLFVEELTRFIVKSDPTAYERAKSMGKAFCLDLVLSNGHPIRDQIFSPFAIGGRNFIESPVEFPRALSHGGRDVASASNLNYEP